MKRLKLNRLLISIVALAMLILVFQPDEGSKPDILQSKIPDSDYFMEDVKVYQYEPDGNIANKLSADRMQHFIEDNLSILDAPLITYNKSDSGSWQLSSPTGKLRNNSLLLLEDNVTIQEFTNMLTPQSMIQTKNLTIDLEKNVASTQERVLIMSPYFATESNGFKFDLSNEIISLTSDVKTEIFQK